MEKFCEICGALAVDVWIDPLSPGTVLWVCLEDLIDLNELYNSPTVLSMGESKEEN